MKKKRIKSINTCVFAFSFLCAYFLFDTQCFCSGFNRTGEFNISQCGKCIWQYWPDDKKIQLDVRSSGLKRGMRDNVLCMKQNIQDNATKITDELGLSVIETLCIRNLDSVTLNFVGLFPNIKNLDLNTCQTYGWINSPEAFSSLGHSLEYLDIGGNVVLNSRFLRTLYNLKSVFVSQIDYDEWNDIPKNWEIVSKDNGIINLNKKVHIVEEKLIKTNKCTDNDIMGLLTYLNRDKKESNYNLTQNEIAELLDVSPSTINNIINKHHYSQKVYNNLITYYAKVCAPPYEKSLSEIMYEKRKSWFRTWSINGFLSIFYMPKNSEGSNEYKDSDEEGSLIGGSQDSSLTEVVKGSYSVETGNLRNRRGAKSKTIPETSFKEETTFAYTDALDTSEIPEIAKGNEESYKQLMSGSLIYKPDGESTVGQIVMPFASIVDPLTLEGTFDLSECGEVSKHVSISIDYRKIDANTKGSEVWIVPKFMAEQNINGSAHYLQPIMSEWSAPFGIFFTTKTWPLDWYAYEITKDPATLNSKNLSEILLSGNATTLSHSPHSLYHVKPGDAEKFYIQI